MSRKSPLRLKIPYTIELRATGYAGSSETATELTSVTSNNRTVLGQRFHPSIRHPKGVPNIVRRESLQSLMLGKHTIITNK